MSDGKDQIYRDGQAAPGSFRFDARVVRVFDDMIRRSVPGYDDTLRMTGWLAARYAQPGTACYDLGCSLGSTLLACARAMHDAEGQRDVALIGVDTSAAMIERCAERLAEALPGQPIRLLEQDIRATDFAPSSVIILNWTLQFVPPEDREALLRRIRDALVPGGALILSEKIIDPDPAAEQLAQQLHAAFKLSQGYSDLEIAAKRNALEAVLIPETLTAQVTRLQALGFAPVLVWSRQLSFVSILAERP